MNTWDVAREVVPRLLALWFAAAFGIALLWIVVHEIVRRCSRKACNACNGQGWVVRDVVVSGLDCHRLEACHPCAGSGYVPGDGAAWH